MYRLPWWHDSRLNVSVARMIQATQQRSNIGSFDRDKHEFNAQASFARQSTSINTKCAQSKQLSDKWSTSVSISSHTIVGKSNTLIIRSQIMCLPCCRSSNGLSRGESKVTKQKHKKCKKGDACEKQNHSSRAACASLLSQSRCFQNSSMNS